MPGRVGRGRVRRVGHECVVTTGGDRAAVLHAVHVQEAVVLALGNAPGHDARGGDGWKPHPVSNEQDYVAGLTGTHSQNCPGEGVYIRAPGDRCDDLHGDGTWVRHRDVAVGDFTGLARNFICADGVGAFEESVGVLAVDRDLDAVGLCTGNLDPEVKTGSCKDVRSINGQGFDDHSRSLGACVRYSVSGDDGGCGDGCAKHGASRKSPGPLTKDAIRRRERR